MLLLVISCLVSLTAVHDRYRFVELAGVRPSVGRFQLSRADLVAFAVAVAPSAPPLPVSSVRGVVWCGVVWVRCCCDPLRFEHNIYRNRGNEENNESVRCGEPKTMAVSVAALSSNAKDRAGLFRQRTVSRSLSLSLLRAMYVSLSRQKRQSYLQLTVPTAAVNSQSHTASRT